jgi:hypothetical protein
MKLSQLIAQAQTIMSEEGDIDVSVSVDIEGHPGAVAIAEKADSLVTAYMGPDAPTECMVLTFSTPGDLVAAGDYGLQWKIDLLQRQNDQIRETLKAATEHACSGWSAEQIHSYLKSCIYIK